MAEVKHCLFFAAVLQVALLATTAISQREDGTNKITYPDSTDLTVHYLDTVDVAFQTNYSTPWMYLFCNASTGALEEIVYYSPSDVTGGVRPFNFTYDYLATSTCWFNLRDAQRTTDDDNTEVGATSPGFTYNQEQGQNQTFALSTAAASSTTASSTATSADSTSTMTSTPTAQMSATAAPAPSSGLSTGAKAGIGVAVGLVGLLVIAGAIFASRRRRLRQNREPNAGSEKRPATGPEENQEWIQELPSERNHHELSPGQVYDNTTYKSPAYSPYELPEQGHGFHHEVE